MTTEYTFDSESLTSLYKDAHGFRPTQTFYENWELMDDDEKQAVWDQMISAEWCNGDWENLAWKHGLPYAYFNGKV